MPAADPAIGPGAQIELRSASGFNRNIFPPLTFLTGRGKYMNTLWIWEKFIYFLI